MGEVAVLFSRHRENLQKEFEGLTHSIEVGEVDPSTCTTTHLERLDALARNPAINDTPYNGEARACLETSGTAFYKAFALLVLFCIRVRHPKWCTTHAA